MFLIIDGFSLLFRAFYGIPDMVSPTGLPTNALYGFMNQITRVIAKNKPQYVCICLDSPGDSFRKDWYQDYKANRTNPPDLLKRQLDIFEKTLATIGIPLWRESGVEADDLIGSLATQYHDGPISIISSDMDLLQLVNPTTTVMTPSKGTLTAMTPTTIQEKYQITPAQIVDYKALKGDPSDNIPGVKGIGDKTAVKLLTMYHSLAGIYDNIDRITPPSIQQKLRLSQDNAYLSFKLATLKTDIPVASLATYAYTLSWEHWHPTWAELGFQSLQNRYTASATPLSDAPKERPVSDPEMPAQQPVRPEARITQLTYDQLPWDKLASGFAIAITGTQLEIAYTTTEALLLPYTTEAVAGLLGSGYPVYGYDAQQVYTTETVSVIHDCLIAAFLLDSGQALALPALCQRYLDISVAMMAPGDTALYIYKLMRCLRPLLETEGLLSLFETIECPLVPVLAGMAKTGIGVDPKRLATLETAFEAERKALTEQIYETAGIVFSIASPQQLGRVLFDHLNLPVIKTNKTGPSTDNSVLMQLNHPVIPLVLRFRIIEKLLTGYIRALPKLINSKTGRIHTVFNQTAVVTGRLSSRNPNLQTIPIRTPDGHAIRGAFVTQDADHELVSADYSQIELRILAHFSQDDRLCHAYASGDDIHKQTAATLFNTPVDAVSKTQRDQAKTVNFGIIYGQSAFTLATQLGISRARAKQLIMTYFKTFPQVKAFIDQTIDQAKADGGVRTAMNRWRAIPELASSRAFTRQHAQRAALNTRIQGSAADMMKIAMLRLHQAVAPYPATLILQVHDEVVLEAHRDCREAIIPLIKDAMIHAMPLSVPITVSVQVGDNWREMTPVS